MQGSIPCLVCGSSLDIDESDVPLLRRKDGMLSCQMVQDGVVCHALGNYGSTVFDPMDRAPTKGFAICDPCFRERQDRMRDVSQET